MSDRPPTDQLDEHLDRAYAAFADDHDDIAPTPEGIDRALVHRRSRRHRRTALVAATATLLVLVLVLTAVTVGWTSRLWFVDRLVIPSRVPICPSSRSTPTRPRPVATWRRPWSSRAAPATRS